MSADRDQLAALRRAAGERIRRNFGRVDDARPAEDRDPAARDVQIALSGPQKRLIKGVMAINPEVRRNIDSVGRAFAPEASSDERGRAQDRFLDKVDWDELQALNGAYVVNGRPPVFVTPRQKAILDSVIGRMGDDPIGQRAKAGYGQAVSNGGVKVRK